MPQNDQDPKSVLREQIRARRRARTESQRADVDSALAERMLEIPDVTAVLHDPTRGCVAAYASYGTEPRTSALRTVFARAGGGVLLPVIRDDGGLDWAWDRDDLGDGAVSPGIPEPTGLVAGHGLEGLVQLGCRVVLAPALAADLQGSRIGKAGGYYDRLLTGLDELAPDQRPHVVAVVHDDEVVDLIPTQPHDRRVDAILTPTRYLPLR